MIKLTVNNENLQKFPCKVVQAFATISTKFKAYYVIPQLYQLTNSKNKL